MLRFDTKKSEIGWSHLSNFLFNKALISASMLAILACESSLLSPSNCNVEFDFWFSTRRANNNP